VGLRLLALPAALAAALCLGHGTAGDRHPADAGPAADQAPAGQWQAAATDAAAVPAAVLQAASRIEIAVVDTGADVSAPALAVRHLRTWNVLTRSHDVTDANGHGTFVASLAAGAGGDAQLLVVKAAGRSGLITTGAEAAAIRYAVDHGARIVNLSFAGTTTSPAERAALAYAARRGVLLVAAAGNDHGAGDPVEYPAALLQPVGSNGRSGVGLAVGASAPDGSRAPFSETGSWLSLAAPGEGVLGSLSRLAPAALYPRAALASAPGLYGYGSGTSFAAPQVAGAAALVWAADPALTARQVAAVLEQTASGGGTWTPELGYGVIDVAAAVARASTFSD
jgi:subtilisin family serine protease